MFFGALHMIHRTKKQLRRSSERSLADNKDLLSKTLLSYDCGIFSESATTSLWLTCTGSVFSATGYRDPVSLL